MHSYFSSCSTLIQLTSVLVYAKYSKSSWFCSNPLKSNYLFPSDRALRSSSVDISITMRFLSPVAKYVVSSRLLVPFTSSDIKPYKRDMETKVAGHKKITFHFGRIRGQRIPHTEVDTYSAFSLCRFLQQQRRRNQNKTGTELFV